MRATFIAAELQSAKDAGLYRQLRLVEGEQGPLLTLDGREVINFSSNNYLGIANHPALAAAAKAAIDRYGCGSGASRLISGNMTLHEELEAKLAQFKNTEAALVFNSGFQANIGILSTLAGEGDVILSDALNHASIIDGCRLSKAQTLVYAHCDLNELEAALKQAASARRRMIVTETIFSMDGDEAPLSRDRRTRREVRRHGDGRRSPWHRRVRRQRRRGRRQVGIGRASVGSNGHPGQSAGRIRRLCRRQPGSVRFVDQSLPQFYLHDFAAAGGDGDGAGGHRFGAKGAGTSRRAPA